MLERIDAVLTRERVRNYSVIFLAVGAITLVCAWLRGPLWAHRPGPPFLPDFLAHWTGGRLLLTGRASSLYDIATQAGLQRSAVPDSSGLAWFVSPPADAILYLPLAALPYLVAAAVWFSLSVVLLAVCLRLTRPLLEHRQRDFALFVLVVLALPATLEVLGSGQDSLLFLILWLAALGSMQRGSEATSGALLGMGLLKPQLILLVPVMLLAQRRFRALAAFSLVACGIVSLCLLLVGPHGVLYWAQTLSSPTYTEQVQQGQAWKMQSLSAFAADVTTSRALPLLALAFGAIVVFSASRRLRHDVAGGFAITALATVVSSPHVLLYDCVLLIPAMAYASRRLNRPSVRVAALLVFGLQWTAPVRHVLAIAVGGSPLLDAPWAAPAIGGLLIVSLHALVHSGSVVAESSPHHAQAHGSAEQPEGED